MLSKDKNIIHNILFIRLSSIGDVVLTTPLLRQFHKAYPSCNIDFVTTSLTAGIFRFNPYVRQIFTYDKTWDKNRISQFKSEIIKSNSGVYDIIIDLQNNLRSGFLRKDLGKSILNVNKRRLNKLALVYFKKPYYDNIVHVVDNYRMTLNDPSIMNDEQGLEIWLENDKKNNSYLSSEFLHIQKDILNIAIAPGAHHFSKRWPSEYFVHLINQLSSSIKCNIVLIGGEPDRELLESISKVSMPDNEVFIGKSIIETAQKLDECSLLITNDTGVMHIASARQVPVLVIYGSTVPALGFTPYKVKNAIIERKDVPCRPCTHIGKANCPKKHFECMTLIKPLDVLALVKSMLDSII